MGFRNRSHMSIDQNYSNLQYPPVYLLDREAI